jgi:hypothetical protein
LSNGMTFDLSSFKLVFNNYTPINTKTSNNLLYISI